MRLHESQSHSGDTLVLFTDGIFEAENVSDEQYGLDRLQNVIETHANAAVD